MPLSTHALGHEMRGIWDRNHLARLRPPTLPIVRGNSASISGRIAHHAARHLIHIRRARALRASSHARCQSMQITWTCEQAGHWAQQQMRWLAAGARAAAFWYIAHSTSPGSCRFACRNVSTSPCKSAFQACIFGAIVGAHGFDGRFTCYGTSACAASARRVSQTVLRAQGRRPASSTH